jgi:hypothetical protein
VFANKPPGPFAAPVAARALRQIKPSAGCRFVFHRRQARTRLDRATELGGHNANPGHELALFTCSNEGLPLD